MARAYELPLSVALVVAGPVMLGLSLTYLSPCGLCSPGAWPVTFLRLLGAGWVGAGVGGLVGVFRRRGSHSS